MIKNFFSRFGKFAVVFVVIIVCVAALFVGSFFVVIDAGQVGVVSTFGTVADVPLQPGFHLKNPLSQIILMNTRTESYTMSSSYGEGEVKGDDSISALAADGGAVSFDVTALYRLKPEAAPAVYRDLGLTYEENVIRPEIRSTIRAVASQYPVTEIYSSKREQVQADILDQLKSAIAPRGLEVDDVLLRQVAISQSLLDSIEQKLAAQQQVQQQQFEIDKAKKEAERKVAEAKGQRDAQSIINESLTRNYLYYLYINQLKDRPGTIYVPLDPSNGLPLFKNVE